MCIGICVGVYLEIWRKYCQLRGNSVWHWAFRGLLGEHVADWTFKDDLWITLVSGVRVMIWRSWAPLIINRSFYISPTLCYRMSSSIRHFAIHPPTDRCTRGRWMVVLGERWVFLGFVFLVAFSSITANFSGIWTARYGLQSHVKGHVHP